MDNPHEQYGITLERVKWEIGTNIEILSDWFNSTEEYGPSMLKTCNEELQILTNLYLFYNKRTNIDLEEF